LFYGYINYEATTNFDKSSKLVKLLYFWGNPYW